MATSARKRKRRLGKGLESLLSKPVEVVPPESGVIQAETAQRLISNKQEQSPSTVETPMVVDGLVYIPAESISPNPRQPRQVFDDDGLCSLADSIKKAGLMQPIVVRPIEGEHTFELVAGERRWKAAQIAGLSQIPSIVRDLDDKTSAEWALIENLQREDLNPIDRAEAFDRLVLDFNVTQQEIADQLGIDRSSVSNFMRLNDLEPSVKNAVRDGRLSMGHAKVLLGIPDASTSKAIARKCASEQWSVRELERRLAKLSASKQPKKQSDPSALEMHMYNLSNQLGDHLGTKVNITVGSKKGSGKLLISFYSNDQFDGILQRLDFNPKS